MRSSPLGFNKRKLSVAVVDISALDSSPVAGRLTPREQLEKLVDAIIHQKPAALGIDLDFSPLDAGWTERGGPQFFDYIRGLPVPVYLGVGRSRYGTPSEWLGAEDYHDLAATIVVPAEEILQMPLWIRQGGTVSCSWLAANPPRSSLDSELEAKPTTSDPRARCLPAMSLALARRDPDYPHHATEDWLSRLCRPFHEQLIDSGNATYVALFAPDYTVARQIQDETSTAVVSDNGVQLVLNPSLTSLKGRLVFLGNTAWEKTFDKYPIPPWRKDVPGVYFHACAAHTLLEGPFSEVTAAGRLALDLAVAILAFASLTLPRLHHSRSAERAVVAKKGRFAQTLAAALVVLAVGYGLAHTTRILWTDSVLIGAAVVFHGLLVPIRGHGPKTKLLQGAELAPAPIGPQGGRYDQRA